MSALIYVCSFWRSCELILCAELTPRSNHNMHFTQSRCVDIYIPKCLELRAVFVTSYCC